MEKPKPNYFLDWFNAVPARWYGMTAILLVLVAVVVAGIIWLADKGLEWWWIVSGVIAILVFMLFSFLAYRKVAIERDEATGDKNRFSQELVSTKDQLEKLRKTPPIQIEPSHYIADNYIRGRIIHIKDLIAPGARPVILKRTIEDCEIRGPAMLVFAEGVNLEDIVLDGDPNTTFIELEVGRPLLGVIGLENCTIRRCHLESIGIIATKPQIDNLKAHFKVPQSTFDKEGSQP